MRNILCFRSRLLTRAVALAVVAVVLAGCATTNSRPATLEARAQARWDHMLKGDFAGAYQYYSPGFRSAVDLPAFERMMVRRTVAWTGAEFRDKGPCTELTCKVRVVLKYRASARVPGAGAFDGARILHEDWIRSENNWFFVPKQ